jgi:predicted Fe-Mo cluster-binding NifX family protein
MPHSCGRKADTRRKNMKIGFTAQGTGWDSPIESRFGRTPYLLCYDEQTEEIVSYDNREMEQTAHGAGPMTAQRLIKMGAEVLLTGNGPGGNADSVLRAGNIKVITGASGMSVSEAYAAWKGGRLP